MFQRFNQLQHIWSRNITIYTDCLFKLDDSGHLCLKLVDTVGFSVVTSLSVKAIKARQPTVKAVELSGFDRQ